MVRVIGVLSTLLAVAPCVASSQPGRLLPEPSAREVALALRGSGYVRNVRETLVQSYGPRRRETLDEIADTLAAISIALPGGDEKAASTRENALFMLFATATLEPGEVGVAYVGALPRIGRIAESAHDAGIRGAAVELLGRLPDRTAALIELERLAKSQGAAEVVIHVLGRKTGPEGLLTARRLYSSGAVTDERAKRMLQALVFAHGWR